MSYSLNDLTDYQLPDSPFHKEIFAAVKSIYEDAGNSQSDDYKREVEDALYFAVKKRMSQRSYTGDNAHYINGLISDINEAQYEHGQVAYSSHVTSQAFQQLKLPLVSILMELNASES